MDVEAPSALIASLLELCDGNNDLDAIVRTLSKRWPRKVLVPFLDHLASIGVLLDATAASSYLWSYVEYPARYPREITEEGVSALVESSARRHRAPGGRDHTVPVGASPLERLLQKRQSRRTFNGEAIRLADIAAMLWAGYGVPKALLSRRPKLERHTVPSAGALYPLHLSVVLFRPSGPLGAGVYDVRFKKPNQVGLQLVHEDTAKTIACFPDPQPLANAQGIAVLSGSFSVVEKKYGNRALLLVPLEIGHAAQNMHLSAVEHHFGTVEIGWFMDANLAASIRLERNFIPMTTIVFGAYR